MAWLSRVLEVVSALFLQVLSRVWNVGGQCGPDVSKGLNNLTIPSVSVRHGGCLFLLCLMRVGLSADIALGCSSRRQYHGFVLGTSRLCGCVQHRPGLLRPQLRLAGTTAAVSFSRHRGYGFGAPAASASFARRHIWLVYLVGLVCLICLVYLVGLSVDWSIGLSCWSGVCGLGVCWSRLSIGLCWRLVCLVDLVYLLLCL